MWGSGGWNSHTEGYLCFLDLRRESWIGSEPCSPELPDAFKATYPCVNRLCSSASIRVWKSHAQLHSAWVFIFRPFCIRQLNLMGQQVRWYGSCSLSSDNFCRLSIDTDASTYLQCAHMLLQVGECPAARTRKHCWRHYCRIGWNVCNYRQFALLLSDLCLCLDLRDLKASKVLTYPWSQSVFNKRKSVYTCMSPGAAGRMLSAQKAVFIPKE